ncbi:nucleoporin protein Ndc1-Nup [Xylariaceae sp. FL1019]|nr:nucleoporin protein Ndc1-Nup [Xylariaceae sp. FL1019]
MPSAVAARRAPYKDFLQPALQRRFAGTAAIILAIAYLEALTLSSWQSLIWSWFPLGLPGIRALGIFASVLPIIILRIAHSHMGIRSSASSFETIANTGLPFRNFLTVLIYGISAWVFSQTYLLSTPEESDLRWITHASGRARLNEQAVFYTVSLTVLGVVQSIVHIAYDRDSMVLGTVRAKTADEGAKSEAWIECAGWIPVTVLRSGMFAIASGLFNYVILYHFLRKSSWSWSMWFFRWWHSELPKSNLPPYSGGPWSFWMLLRTIWASFLLSLLWQFADVAFRVQLSREPLKNGQPLTTESKDPNGSLLNGLKSRKERVSAFAMWELALIARDYEARRMAIFDDIDRKEGPMWPQVYGICIDVIRGLERRIDDYGKPPAPAASAVPAAEATQRHERIAQPIRTDDVLIPRASSKTAFVKRTVSKVVTSPGRTLAEDYGPELKKRAADVTDRLITKEQQAALKPEALQGRLGALATQVLTLPVIGPLFQSTFARRLTKAVIGSPYAELSVYVNAAYALSQLAVYSLAEDKYGNVQRDVPSIVRTLTAVIKKLERFRDEFPAHWTDASKSRECPEVEKLLVALKDDLNALVTAFAPYSSDLRLTRADMRLAREAAEKKEESVVEQDAESPQMQQAD